MTNDPIHAAIERAAEYYVTRALPDQDGEDKKESMSDLSIVISVYVLPVVEERERGLTKAAYEAAHWACDTGRVYAACGEKETPAELAEKVERDTKRILRGVGEEPSDE